MLSWCPGGCFCACARVCAQCTRVGCFWQACSGRLNCSRRFVCSPVPRGRLSAGAGASSVTCHFLSAHGPWTAISPGRWMWTVLSGQRMRPPQAPRPRVPSGHGCCEGSLGMARLLCTGLDASAECRFSLCYCTPCQADFFLPEKFKAKTRI